MAGDPNYASVSLLLHGNGADGSTTIVDNSAAPKSATVFGDAQISTAQSKFGGSSLKFNGAGDYLQYADDDAFSFGGGAFTVECWVRLAGYANNNAGQYNATILGKDINTAREFSLAIIGTSSSYTTFSFLGAVANAPTVVSASYSFSLNTWYHVAAVRSGNLLYLFVDGVLLNTGGTAFSISITNTTTPMRVGALMYDATYPYYLNGALEDIRITNGVARYTATFTPPAREFPNGLGEVEGVVRDDTGTLCARTVRLIRRDTGALLSSAVSDATTGAYRLATPTLDEVQRIVLDDSTGTLYNDLIDRVIPA